MCGALDTYRARLHGEPEPPAPGRHDWRVLREVRDRGRFRAAVACRPARGRLRTALSRHLRLRRRGTS